MSFQWNNANIQAVAYLLKQRASASEIAAELGITRNAIIGKVRRDKDLRAIGFAYAKAHPFGGRAPKKFVKNERRPLEMKRVTPRSKQPTIAPDPEYTVAKPMLLLGAHDCRWPINSADGDEQHLFCAGITEKGKSFCAHHLHRAFDHRRASHV